MPYTTTYSDCWYCSWLCGYKNKSEKRVRNHEDMKHGAATEREVEVDEEKTKNFSYFAIGKKKDVIE